jgi:hypothetical protein
MGFSRRTAITIPANQEAVVRATAKGGSRLLDPAIAAESSATNIAPGPIRPG